MPIEKQVNEPTELIDVFDFPNTSFYETEKLLAEKGLPEDKDELLKTLGTNVIGLPNLRFNEDATSASLDWEHPRFVIAESTIRTTLRNVETMEAQDPDITEPEGISSGGLGLIIDAYDLNLGRYVKVKIANNVIYNSKAQTVVDATEVTSTVNVLESPDKEVQLLTTIRLSDPDVVIPTIYSRGVLPARDGVHAVPFFVMEEVDGVSLNEAEYDSPKIIIDIGIKIAKALDELNAKNIYHLDLKPSNLMIDKEGIIYIIDWGIGDTQLQAEESNKRFGTKQFSSPEQLQKGQTSKTSDQYALAATMWTLLTGTKLMWEDETATNMEYASPEAMQSKSQTNEDMTLVKSSRVDAKTYEVFQKALSYDPDKRYGSCKEFMRALSETMR